MSAIRTEPSASSGPLAGILVADFSRVLAGPYATMLLADLGAEVIKVESPAGDETRTWMPPERDGESTYYLGINRNKRSLALDLRAEDDLTLGQRLADRADVLIQNFKPGGLVKYGLDYDSVAERNPSVVYASISGFGAAGGADMPGYDLIVQAVSGLMSLTGDPDGQAYRAGMSVFDILTGNHAVIGILAALRHRDTTGDGQHVEVNLLSSALNGLGSHSSAWALAGEVPYRMGNSHPSVFPYEPLPTGDDDLVVVAANDRQFAALCDVLGVPELAADERFLRNVDRTGNRAELEPLLVERLATKGAQEWAELLLAAGVPSGPVNTIDQGFALAERLGLEPIVTTGGATDAGSAQPTVRHPISYSRSEVSYDQPPPDLDEHGPDLRKWLADDV